MRSIPIEVGGFQQVTIGLPVRMALPRAVG
jgi:hypothetical protein